MSTDRELTKWAAKAAGLWDAENDCVDIPWLPLVSDADAFRLAVKLRLHIQPSATTKEMAPSVEVYDTEDRHSKIFEVMLGDDPCAATRRAIVLVAASIGEQMP